MSWNDASSGSELPCVLVLVGPTAIGKTAVAIQVARTVGGEIVSADARQIYRYMDIGTAKPTPEEQRQVRHHLIDLIPPDQSFDAGRYGREARRVIQSLLQRSIPTLLVGGSGFYLQAATSGLYQAPPADPLVREKLRIQARQQGTAILHQRLAQIDPPSAQRIHPNDLQRLVRALEIYEKTGLPPSQLPPVPSPPFSTLWVGLTQERTVLNTRINRRVEAMLEAGLVDEVNRLRAMGYGRKDPGLNTFGYKEIIDYLEGVYTLDKAVAAIKKNSRRYAKRQLTWFRRCREIHWIKANTDDTTAALAAQILNLNWP